MSSNENMPSVWDKILSSLGNTIRVTGELIAGTAYVAAASISLIHQANVLARRYRWGLSTTWPIEFIFQLGTLSELEKPALLVDGRIVQYYSRNSWGELHLLVDNICGYDSPGPFRKRVLRESLWVLRAAEQYEFRPALFIVPQLFAQLEGILQDFARTDLAIKQKQSKSTSVRNIISALRGVASPIERPGLNVITNSMFKSYKNRPAPKGKRLLNRHYHAHGKIKALVGAAEMLRIFLAIDLVAYLIDKSRGLMAHPRMEMRIGYADLLSAFSKSGRELAPSWLQLRASMGQPTSGIFPPTASDPGSLP